MKDHEIQEIKWAKARIANAATPEEAFEILADYKCDLIIAAHVIKTKYKLSATKMLKIAQPYLCYDAPKKQESNPVNYDN